MVKVLKKNWLLILLVLIAAFLRFFKISSIPPSLNWDEVAIGWNAKTIFHTRRDEFGRLLPLVFQSFGDFKAPLLIYLTAPFVGLLGLKELVVRFPSVIASLITIITFFFLSKEVGQKLITKEKYQKLFSYLSTIFIIFSPWHYLFSRPAFEPNIALMWVTLGAYFFIKGIKSHKFILLSGFTFLASIYTYHSPKLFLPPFLIVLFCLFYKDLVTQIKNNSKFYLVSTVLLILLSLPIVNATLSGPASNRAKGTTIFYDQQDNLRSFDYSFVKDFSQNYLTHLKPQFYLNGTQENYRLGLKDNGIMTYAQWLGLVVGAISLLFIWKNKFSKLILFWFVIAIFPSTLGKDIMPNNLRSLNMLPAAILISAYGIIFVISKIKTKLFRLIFASIFIVTYSFQTIGALKEYFIDYPVYSASDWQYGYKQVALLAQEYEDDVDHIILTGDYGQPHIFTYFFQNRDPLSVFWGGMIKYEFRSINWLEDKGLKNFLIIGTPSEIPHDDPLVIKIIDYPDGSPAFIVAKTSST